MKTQRLFKMGLALIIGSATANAAIARDTSHDEHFIRATESAICDAFVSSDADVLRDDLDDHFTLTDAKGAVTTREQTILAIKQREPVYLLYRNHDQTVRLSGDTAIVAGITSIQGHTGGGSTFSDDYAYTDNWIHEDGRWKLAASHASALPAK
jgi:ketosteroid isomerase-like protein